MRAHTHTHQKQTFEYVRKGSQIYVEGSLRTREWQDQQGNRRFSTEIQAAELKLLGRRAETK